MCKKPLNGEESNGSFYFALPDFYYRWLKLELTLEETIVHSPCRDEKRLKLKHSRYIFSFAKLIVQLYCISTINSIKRWLIYQVILFYINGEKYYLSLFDMWKERLEITMNYTIRNFAVINFWRIWRIELIANWVNWNYDYCIILYSTSISKFEASINLIGN